MSAATGRHTLEPEGEPQRSRPLGTTAKTALCLALLAGGLASYAAALWQHRHSGWVVADWLIGLDGGFSRRALGGWVVGALASTLGVAPWVLVPILQLAIYAAFLGLLLGRIAGRRWPTWFLFLLFAPASIFYHLANSDVVGRKEAVTFLLLALFVHLQEKGRLASIHISGWFFAGVVATLLHELFAFYAIYFVGAALLGGERARSRRALPRAWAIVAGAAFAAVALALAGPIDGAATCRRIVEQGGPAELCDGILAWPARSMAAEIAATLAAAAEKNYLGVYPLAAVLCCLPLVLRWSALRPWRRAVGEVGFVALAFTLSIPMFLLGTDWGRWLGIHVVAWVILASATLDRGPGAWTEGASAASAKVRRVLVGAVGAAALLAYAGAWHPPYWGGGPLGGGLFSLVALPAFRPD